MHTDIYFKSEVYKKEERESERKNDSRQKQVVELTSRLLGCTDVHV